MTSCMTVEHVLAHCAMLGVVIVYGLNKCLVNPELVPSSPYQNEGLILFVSC